MQPSSPCLSPVHDFCMPAVQFWFTNTQVNAAIVAPENCLGPFWQVFVT